MLSTQSTNPKPLSAYLATYGLWLTTAILAVYEISLVREIVASLYAWLVVLFDRTAQYKTNFEAAAMAQGITLVMGILAIVIIIGGFEYHHKRVGQGQSLKVLLWTLGIQVGILVLGLVL